MWFDYYRRATKFTNVSFDEFVSDGDFSSLEDDLIRNEERSELYKRIDLLDKNTRKVMYLKLLGELSFKEIGIIMDKNENWARVTFYRGKLRLKEVD